MNTKNIFQSFSLLIFLFPGILKSQILETEESKPLLTDQFAVGASVEFQTSKEGTETALPLEIEYGLSKKISLLIEPVAFTSINPKTGMKANGIGDLEITLFYQVVSEKKVLPSISLSFEVKIPTANNNKIGTGEFDYTPFIISSKTTGRFFTSMNLSYTFLGKPPGVNVTDLFNYALGTIFTASKKSILYAEVYGNTSAFGEGDMPEGTGVTNPITGTTEISGGETVGGIGYGYYLNKDLLLSFGVSYDNNNAFLIRPGIEWKFGGK